MSKVKKYDQCANHKLACREGRNFDFSPSRLRHFDDCLVGICVGLKQGEQLIRVGERLKYRNLSTSKVVCTFISKEAGAGSGCPPMQGICRGKVPRCSSCSSAPVPSSLN